MKPESRDYLRKAKQKLDRAGRALHAQLFDIAAREAYLAALAAARAAIFELAEIVTKTHSGAGQKFHEIVGRRKLIAPDLMTVLDDGRDIKSAVDYDTSPLPSAEASVKYMERAQQFVAALETMLESEQR
jgi:uncharacterized protein (UPF0332 family)